MFSVYILTGIPNIIHVLSGPSYMNVPNKRQVDRSMLFVIITTCGQYLHQFFNNTPIIIKQKQVTPAAYIYHMYQ